MSQVKIVLAAFKLPPVASVDTKTVGLDATAGHPQDAPRSLWAKLGAIVATAIAAVATNFEIVFCVFIFLILIVLIFGSIIMNGRCKYDLQKIR